MKVLKEDYALFFRLYITCQIPDGNFIKCENQAWPPSLLQLGQLIGGQKANCVTNDLRKFTKN